MTKPKYDLGDLTIFATYDGMDAHTNFVAEVADSALNVIREYANEVERLQARERELDQLVRAVEAFTHWNAGVRSGEPWDVQSIIMLTGVADVLAAVEKRPTKGDQEGSGQRQDV